MADFYTVHKTNKLFFIIITDIFDEN